jgi:GTPase Era involved in 16S rRNA processing
MKQTETTHPAFAVVGHPNKGKSAIVSSLAMDDSIAVSNIPGTTDRRQSYPLRVDGKIIYELYDTPGFQRARQVLAWLKSHDVSADRRHEVVQAFLNAHRDDPRFHDEVELLTPIMEGAGIIYVVDASKPYGEEYEAEMEILRWTGQPSMALINHIDEEDYSAEWKRALGGYFQIIRTYNPMHTDLQQQIAILESMAQLREEWTVQVKASIALFVQYREQMLERSVAAITRLMHRALSHVERLPLTSDNATESDKERLKERYKAYLRQEESRTQAAIERIWHHEHLQTEVNPLGFEQMDLFSEESASVFGLTRKELLIGGVTTGAVTGAGVDLLFGGATFLLGGAIGAVVGGVGAYMAFDELSEVKLLGKRLGKRYLEMGPMQNRNFPYILLGRMLYYTTMVAARSHAKRDALTLAMDSTFRERWLDEKVQKSLEKYHKQWRSGKGMDDEMLKSYESLVEQILKKLMEDL